QPPIITGFQFDETPVAQGIQRLISLLDQLDQRAQRVTSRLQGQAGGGLTPGITADQHAVETLTTTIHSLETNLSTLTTGALASFQAIQTRIETVAAAMLNLRNETGRTGAELER